MSISTSSSLQTDVVVIGAGQAGLSAGYFLRRFGYRPESGFVLLDGNDGPGGAWRHRWSTLRLERVHGVYQLPGMRLSAADPKRPASEVMAQYFGEYESRHALPVHRPVSVEAVHDGPDGRLLVRSTDGVWASRAVINATGTWTRPFWPYYPGTGQFRGRQLHTADYDGPSAFRGARVVVVGAGTSAVQLLLEIAEVAETMWVTRREPRFREGPFDREAGRRAVHMIDQRVRRGLPPGSVVAGTGLPVSQEVRAGMDSGVLTAHPMFSRLTPRGIAWADGSQWAADVIVWATGFRPALDHLAPLGLREAGGGIRVEGTRVVADPRLHLTGYGPTASTIGANRAGRSAVKEITALLADGQDLGHPVDRPPQVLEPGA